MSTCRWEGGICVTRRELAENVARAIRLVHDPGLLPETHDARIHAYHGSLRALEKHHCGPAPVTPVEVPPAGEPDSQAGGPAPSAGAPHAVAYGRCVDAIEAYSRASISLGRPDAGSRIIAEYTDARRACYAALDALHDLTPTGHPPTEGASPAWQR